VYVGVTLCRITTSAATKSFVPPGNPPAVRFDDLPTILTVLRKLGLGLQQQEATVPVYTVEHSERPAGD